jgi:hypothetical protein
VRRAVTHSRLPSTTGEDSTLMLLLLLPRTVALKLTLRRNGQQDELLFERSIVVLPSPPSAATPMASSSSRPHTSADTSAAVARPTSNGSRHPFTIAIPSTLPQCLHQPGLSLAYTLSAHLTLSLPSSARSASTSSPPPSEVLTERMDIHLCPSGRPSSQAAPLIRPVPAPGRTPRPVLVGFPKTRCRKSEPIRLWVEIPIPDQQALEAGVGLRNVRAELWRVVTATASSSSSNSVPTGPSSTEHGHISAAGLPPSKVAQAPCGLGSGSGSIATLLTTTGSSCRFSPLSPIRLRLSVHAPLSPSSAYQLTCGHLSQHVAAEAGELVDVRFWVKVMVGFVGAKVDEVDCEQEIVVLGDLDDARDDLITTSSHVADTVTDIDSSKATAALDVVEPARPFTKEKPYEGETYRQSDGAGPSSSVSRALPPGFIETLPSFGSLPSSSSAQASSPHDPPPFSDYPSGATLTGARGLSDPPSPSNSRPPPFTSVATALQDPSPPPPTFFESVPQTGPPESLAPLGAVVETDASLAPLLNLPPQVAPPTSPSADPANLPADWLEVDGYETFSLPAPSVSIGLEAEGSVDPPQEGEGVGVDRGRLERIYDSISPSALRASSSGASSADGVASQVGGIAMTREGSRVDDPNDLPPTFRDLALSSAPPSDDPPHFHQLAVERSSASDELPPHPSEVRSESMGLTRQQGTEVVPPPYAGDDGHGSGSGVTRVAEADEIGEQPPRYS